MMAFQTINIIDMVEALGEDVASAILSEFSCVQNQEIEEFLKNKAIDFAYKKLSVTYLVLAENGQIAGYFTLTHKPMMIDEGEFQTLSKEKKKKITRFCKMDATAHTYTASAFLIAQFGKNSHAGETGLTGDLLMNFALDELKAVQRRIGGGLIFLECEENAKLLAFYENDHNRYKRYGLRHADDGKDYVQLLRLF